MNVKYIILIVVIIAFGATLRLIFLDNNPSGFFRDEAALGYNAYSIWHTGKDEYGVSFPYVFRSFEVFFLPLYVYLSAPIVGVLGLSEFSARFLSAISGILALFSIWAITFEIWRDKKIACLAVIILTVSPWHIFYSRGAFEGNLALTLFSFGFLFLYKFLEKNSKYYFFLAGLFFSLSMYSYQAERLVVPLFALFALILIFKQIDIKKLIIPAVLILIILLPLFSLTFKAGGYHRATGVSIFTKPVPGWIEGQQPGILINNHYILRSRQIAALYLSYFSPQNLFTLGDYDKQRSVEDFSVFYALLFPALLFGFWGVFKKRALKEKLLLGWIFIAPIPASLTSDPFHTYRSLLLYFPLSILIGFGTFKIAELFGKLAKYFYAIFLLILLISLSQFLYSYFVTSPLFRASYWDFGYRGITDFVKGLPQDTHIVIDDNKTESYIYFLFYGLIDPTTYQKQVSLLKPLDQYYYQDPTEIRPEKVGRFEFRQIYFGAERGNSKEVFIMSADNLPKNLFENDPKLKLLKEISYPNSESAFRIIYIK